MGRLLLGLLLTAWLLAPVAVVAAESSQFGVFLLNVSGGSLYIGTEDSLKNRRSCEFKLGGPAPCAQGPPITYQRLAGPFESIEQAQASLCEGVTNKRRVPLLSPPLNLSGQWRNGAWYALVEASVTAVDCTNLCRSVVGSDDLYGRFGIFALNISGGSLYLGTEESLKDRRACEFKLGGSAPCPQAPPITYQSLAGPFETAQDARVALCRGITNTRIVPGLPPPLNASAQWQGGKWYALVEPGVATTECGRLAEDAKGQQGVGPGPKTRFVGKADTFATPDVFKTFEGTGDGEGVAQDAIASARRLDKLVGQLGGPLEYAAFAKGSALFGKKTAGDFDEAAVLVTQEPQRAEAAKAIGRTLSSLASSLHQSGMAVFVQIVLRDRTFEKQAVYRMYPNGDYNETQVVEDMKKGKDNILLKYQERAPGKGLGSMVQHEATLFVGHRPNGRNCPLVGTISGQEPGFNPAFVTRVGVQITDDKFRGVKPTWDFARSNNLDPRGSEVVFALGVALEESASSFHRGAKYVKALKRLYQIGIVRDDKNLLDGVKNTGVLEGDINYINTIADRVGTVATLLGEQGIDPRQIAKDSEELIARSVIDTDAIAARADEKGLLKAASARLKDWHADGQEAANLKVAVSGLKEWLALSSTKKGKPFLDEYFAKKRVLDQRLLSGTVLEVLNGLRNQLQAEDRDHE